jgi:sulfotransferase family protein
MSIKMKINTALGRAFGYKLVQVRRTETRRSVQPGKRLLREPVFVLSSIRSGSTLLRVMLNGHSQLYAPHELHLGHVVVTPKTKLAKAAMSDLGYDEKELTNMLWDRLLADALRRSGKTTLVDKTPAHVFMHKRLATTWPDARFIFLMRHPGSMYQSWHSAHPDKPEEELAGQILKYVTAVEKARSDLDGIDVRYEDLTADPEAQTRKICEYLRIPWERSMVEYGEQKEGDFRRGLGDWSDKIRSGRPQEGRPLPTRDEVPESLHEICRTWGYFSRETAKR